LITAFYKKKKILITGHTGFKGSWLCLWLKKLGAELSGIALDPKTKRDNFVRCGLSESLADYRFDIRDRERLFQVVKKEQPEIIFHLAAQPLVLESYRTPLETFETNVMGTVNILEAFRQQDRAGLLMVITTDKVYDNREWVWGYREDDRLGGKDPYSASKAAAELTVQAYYHSFFSKLDEKKVVTVRAGNVLGGGDWSENRIIPDCMKAIEENRTILVRNPGAVRPWQHVLDPLGGYLLLGEKVMSGEIPAGGAWNFGPFASNQVTVERLVSQFIAQVGRGTYTSLPNSGGYHEAGHLSLDISKAIQKLGWSPMLDFEETVAWTAEWYKNENCEDVRLVGERQIEMYMKRWNSKKEI
jgi:CDP-glucose 4,6-dehydratase